MNTIEIWAPRFKDMRVLVAPWYIQTGPNRIIFTKTWKDKVLIMDGGKMKSYPMESNGKVGCYAIPVKDFDVETTIEQERQLSLC